MTRRVGAVALAVAAVVAALVGGAVAWRVGASSATILPPVNGRTDYWTPVSDENADSPGTCVAQWDFGRISVGNGDTESVRRLFCFLFATPASS